MLRSLLAKILPLLSPNKSESNVENELGNGINLRDELFQSHLESAEISGANISVFCGGDSWCIARDEFKKILEIAMAMASREKSQRHDLGTTIACQRGAAKIDALSWEAPNNHNITTLHVLRVMFEQHKEAADI